VKPFHHRAKFHPMLVRHADVHHLLAANEGIQDEVKVVLWELP
jgi:hypothetical protein